MRDREPTAPKTYIQGQPASELEANYAEGLRRNGKEFTFQYEVETAVTVPGEEKNVDFIVWDGIGYPREIDGNFVHKSAEQREYDRVRDSLIDEALQRQGGFGLLRRITEEYVATPDMAEMTVREDF